MAKKKKNSENEPIPGGEFGESFPTEGFTQVPGAPADDEFGMPTEDLGASSGGPLDFGQATEDLAGVVGASGGGFGMPTEDMGGPSFQTEEMGGAMPPPPSSQNPTLAVPRGVPVPRNELDELDDVLVLLPDEDSGVAGMGGSHMGTQEMQSAGFGMTEADTGFLPGSESPTGHEEVQLLAQHPEYGIMPSADEMHPMHLEELPDIEDVEDITSLVEDAVAHQLPVPQADFDDEVIMGPPPRRRSAFGVMLRMAALVAILGAGAFYGPELYDQYLGEGRTAIASQGGENPNGGETPDDPITDPVATGDPGTGIAGEVPAEFHDWVDGVLAQNFGAPTPDGR